MAENVAVVERDPYSEGTQKRAEPKPLGIKPGNVYVAGLAFMFLEPHLSLLTIHKLKGPSFNVDRLNGIGGKVEGGEFGIEAMVREFEEETGARTNHDDWEHFLTLDVGGRVEPATVYFYRAHFTQGLDWRTTEVEPVMSVPLGDVRVDTVSREWTWGGLKFAPNLPWIVPMAMNPFARDASVTEHHLTPYDVI